MNFFTKRIGLTTLSVLAAGATFMNANGCSTQKSQKKLLDGIKKISVQKGRPLKDRVCDAYFLVAKDTENYKGFVYLCTSGVPTCGYGSSIDTPARRCQIEFFDAQGKKLSPQEVEKRFKEIYDRRAAYKTGTDKKGRPVYNYRADTYKKDFALFVSRESAEKLCKSDIGQCYTALQTNFKSAGMKLEEKPFCLIVGCMDPQYNSGSFNKEKWPNCFRLIALNTPAGFRQAAEETNRGQVSKERNQLVKELFLLGAGEKQQQLQLEQQIKNQRLQKSH